MAREGVITSNGLNCYGGRVLTEGGILDQYKRNPVLLYMHKRGYDGKTMPIGRIEDIRIEGDKLIGTPVFDEKDEFAKQVGQKWEDGFLRMFSAGIEILETSSAPELLVPGQTRPTVTKWKLEEVSIVDIGGNDEALRLTYQGKVLNLCSVKDSDVLPLLKSNETEGIPEVSINNQFNKNSMNKEFLQLLGLPETAGDVTEIVYFFLDPSGDSAQNNINYLKYLALFENEVTLPLNTRMSDEDVEYVIDNFIEVVKNL